MCAKSLQTFLLVPLLKGKEGFWYCCGSKEQWMMKVLQRDSNNGSHLCLCAKYSDIPVMFPKGAIC